MIGAESERDSHSEVRDGARVPRSARHARQNKTRYRITEPQAPRYGPQRRRKGGISLLELDAVFFKTSPGSFQLFRGDVGWEESCAARLKSGVLL